MLDWITSNSGYWAVAITLLAAGLLIAVMGWIGDRWRYGTKTPRCRRCRYDMSGMKPEDPSRKCSECGYEHRKVSQLHQPRKGWKRMVLGGLMVWASLYLLLSPDVRLRMEKVGEPWHIGAIPDTVRIALWPWLDDESRKRFGEQWASSVHLHAVPPAIVPLDEWQVRLYMGQLERDTRSTDTGRRRRAIELAGGARRQYESIADRAADILRSGMNDPHVEVRHESIMWILFDGVELTEADLLRVLEIALHEPAPPSGGKMDHANETRMFAIDILTRHASRIPKARVEQLWESLIRSTRNFPHTVAAVPCLWAIDPDKAAAVTFQLLRDIDSDVSYMTLMYLPRNSDTWNLIADYFRVCPANEEERVANALQSRDDARFQQLLAYWQASTNPQLKAKADRAVRQSEGE